MLLYVLFCGLGPYIMLLTVIPPIVGDMGVGKSTWLQVSLTVYLPTHILFRNRRER